jgi:hypothetical protein
MSRAALVDDILSVFVTQRDKNNEYVLRYASWQTGNSRFAEEIAALFPTRKNTKTYSRTDKEVTAAMANESHIAEWRKKYGFLPHNTHALIDEWLVERLSEDDDDDSSLKAAACLVFASRSTVTIAPEIVEWNGILFAAWRETEKCGKPRLVPLLFKSVSRVAMRQWRVCCQRRASGLDTRRSIRCSIGSRVRVLRARPTCRARCSSVCWIAQSVTVVCWCR